VHKFGLLSQLAALAPPGCDRGQPDGEKPAPLLLHTGRLLLSANRLGTTTETAGRTGRGRSLLVSATALGRQRMPATLAVVARTGLAASERTSGSGRLPASTPGRPYRQGRTKGQRGERAASATVTGPP